MLLKNKKLVISLALLGLLVSSAFVFKHSYRNELESSWGEQYVIPDDISPFLDIPIMKRLKGIDQSGPSRYFGPMLPSFSRYEHSVGVWALLKKTGANLKEQIAGLLHDSSHTVFSHIADFLFAKNVNEFTERGYQDTIHMEFLKKNNINKFVENFRFNINDLNPEKKEYTRLEQSLPDMCADRIQYNIHTGVILKLISKKNAKRISDNVSFKDGKWFFTDEHLAKKFAELSLYFTQNFWGAKWNVSLDMHFSNALARALQLKLIKYDDLFLTDNVILNKLVKNQDHLIQLNLQQCKEPLKQIPGKDYKSVFFKPKFRGIDPLVESKSTGKLIRLSEVDQMFKHYYDSVKEWCALGYTIDILTSQKEASA